MQKIITLIAALLAFLPLLPGQQMAKDPLLGLRVDVVYLSSDLLEGRETGKEGETMAAQYIAHRFQELGLEPKGADGSWYQNFDFNFKAHPHAETGEPRTGRNVLGYLDNGAEQTVIIGAHYDHLGHGIMGSLNAGDPAIHNGADDNASGVAAMLRIAEELKSGRAKNNNYLFMGFSGEEMGLYGSKYFANNPTFDLAKANYMLNMDMVGRLNEEKVLAVNGAGTSPAWKEVIEGLSIGGIQAKTTDSGIGPSDHTSFYLKDIPVLHFFTGQHTDYHKPSDDAELVNYQGLLLVTDYILALIEELDDNGELAFTKTKDEDESRKAAAFKVTLGVMPDYVYSGEGMRIDGVIDGRPGAKAGLENGDIIIKIGDTEVKDIYGYMEGLGKYKTGDKTIVVVKRGEEVLEKEVEF
ncbi:MAG: M28 family peptidase [Lewinellaceae bacterium]|nr:M28 family peptidase [Lewinellaceae bacterium]